jgi:hypothetical protein
MGHVDQLLTDPCLARRTFSGQRFLAFTLLFVLMIGGGFTLFFTLGSTLFGIQLASVVSYTAFVMIDAFARNKNGIRPYLFTCPVVVSQYPRLLMRHAAFLTALVSVETIVLRIKLHHFGGWLGSNGFDLFFALAAPAGAIAILEILSIRDALQRAHEDRFDDYPVNDQPDKDKPLSILGRS